MKEYGFSLKKKIRSRRYPAETIMGADYSDDIAFLAEFLLHSLENAAGGIGLHVNADKTDYIYFNHKGDISTLNGSSPKLVDKFTYLGSRVSSTDNNISLHLVKAWTAIDILSIMWEFYLSDEIKRNFFSAAVVSILLHGCTTWTLTKSMEKKLNGNCTRMLRDILNKFWKQHPMKQ